MPKTKAEQPDDRRPPVDQELVDVRRDAIVKAREQLKELVEQITVGRLLLEQTCEMQRLNATHKFNWYRALVDAGFTEHQAMSLIINDG